ncbi:MAG: hypothetical protein ACP5QA_16140 [Phycisphaerae bacterium]
MNKQELKSIIRKILKESRKTKKRELDDNLTEDINDDVEEEVKSRRPSRHIKHRDLKEEELEEEHVPGTPWFPELDKEKNDDLLPGVKLPKEPPELHPHIKDKNIKKHNSRK